MLWEACKIVYNMLEWDIIYFNIILNQKQVYMITIYVYTFCIICYNSSKKYKIFYIPFCFKMPLAVLWQSKRGISPVNFLKCSGRYAVDKPLFPDYDRRTNAGPALCPGRRL